VYSEHRIVSAVAQVRIEIGRCSAFDITEDSFPNGATGDRRSVEFQNRTAYRGCSATLPSPQVLNIVTVVLKYGEKDRIKR
jgi:hypothetical protein